MGEGSREGGGETGHGEGYHEVRVEMSPEACLFRIVKKAHGKKLSDIDGGFPQHQRDVLDRSTIDEVGYDKLLACQVGDCAMKCHVSVAGGRFTVVDIFAGDTCQIPA